jgi:predicted MPP superfamily phosphohydrolase
VARTWIRDRLLPALRTTSVGIAGAWLALVIVGPLEYTVGPFEVTYYLRPGPGQTEISLPPFGRLTVDTHSGPLHFTAALQSVDPDRATEALRSGDLTELAGRMEAEAVEAIRTHAFRALGIGALGAGVLGLVLYRRRWRAAAAALLAGTLILGSTEGLARATYRPEAFLDPTFHGSLRVAARLLGPIRQASARIQEFRSEIARLAEETLTAYEGLAAADAPSAEALTVLHVSDIHGSPLGMDLAKQLAASFDTDLVVDTGDITSFGTPLEAAVVDEISSFRVPYVFIRGNHDSPAIEDDILDEGNAVILDGEARTIEGLTIYGAPHPLYTPDPGLDLDDEQIATSVARAGEDLVEDLTTSPEPPDIVAVHDDRMALAAQGLVPLVISGHFHQANQTVNEGTMFLRTGSTGGGGLDTFRSDVRPYPLSAEILYFEGSSPELVAVDLVELDPDTRDLTVDRELASELLGEEPVPGPSPS